jgi:ankyrin repeat protein
MDPLQQILIEFELHSVQGIEDCFRQGVSPNAVLSGQPLIHHLINMYSRGPRFKECIRAFVNNGLEFDDKALLAVLLDDSATLDNLLHDDSSPIHRRYSFNCTFTPLLDASLLHICAEYNHVQCAEVLVKHGADIDAEAGFDANGFGGQTPVFHTVNQHANKSEDMLKFLLQHNADLGITVKGLIWGKDYEWETFIPSVNPVSYAMMGLLRQFQRTETDIYHIVSMLMMARYGSSYVHPNVANKYLKH